MKDVQAVYHDAMAERAAWEAKRRESETLGSSGLGADVMPSEPMDVTLYKQMSIPTDLVFAVAKMVEMVDAGWEPCGFQGGGSSKVQFQKVEFRRRRNPIASSPIAGSRPDGLFNNRQKAERHIATDD